MAVLLVDIGNTCFKYALLNDLQQPVEGLECLWGLSTDEAMQVLRQAAPSDLDLLLVSCVGKAEQLASLRAAFAGVVVRVAVVENNWQGFVLGYQTVSNLGVDRWLAMLALRSRLRPGELGLIADCGTAVTVEGVSQDRHLGGLIAPGLGLMARALQRDTADLPAVDYQQLAGGDWAHSTEEAIAGGCMASVLGLLERQRRLLEVHTDGQMASRVQAFLTGGDAVHLRSHLTGWVLDQHLVLEGLRLWALGCE